MKRGRGRPALWVGPRLVRLIELVGEGVPAKLIARELQSTPDAVRTAMANHGLRLRNTSRSIWAGPRLDRLIELVEAGEPVKVIARDLKASPGAIRSIMFIRGLSLRRARGQA